jgi:hypothetical protein
MHGLLTDGRDFRFHDSRGGLIYLVPTRARAMARSASGNRSSSAGAASILQVADMARSKPGPTTGAVRLFHVCAIPWVIVRTSVGPATGLLRATGLRRSQVMRMITVETVVISVFGALLGVVVGTGLGAATVRALKDQGITEYGSPGLKW